MSYARFLRENRHEVIDLRVDDEPIAPRAEPEEGHGSEGAASRRSGRRSHAMAFRPVRPAFAPSFHAQPLPYIEPWERR